MLPVKSSHKRSIFIAVALFSLWSLTGNVLAAASSSGLLIYSEPPSTYVESCEYVSVVSGPAYSMIIRPDGKRFQLGNNAQLTKIDYPTLNPALDTPAVANANIEKIQGAISRYAQFKTQLLAVQAKWQNALTVAKQFETRQAAVEAENEKKAAEQKKQEEAAAAKLKIEKEKQAALDAEKEAQLAKLKSSNTISPSPNQISELSGSTPSPKTENTSISISSAKSFEDLIKACAPCPVFKEVSSFEKGKFYQFPNVKISQAYRGAMLVYYTVYDTHSRSDGGLEQTKEERLCGWFIFPNETVLESVKMVEGADVSAVGQFSIFKVIDKETDMRSAEKQSIPVFVCPGLSISGKYYSTK